MKLFGRISAAGVLLLVTAGSAGDVAGREYVWTAALYAPVADVPINNQLITIRFPVLGEALPGGFGYSGGPNHNPPGRDDFCETFNRDPVNDPNDQCDLGWGHGGHDIMPKSTLPPEDYPIISARAGNVVSSYCSVGGGHTVVVQGFDGRFYHYLHMSSRSISVGEYAAEGRLLGRMGKTRTVLSTGQCGGSTAYHLHFEVRQGSNAPNKAIDMWRSLRESYAFVGRLNNGTGHDNAFNLGWSVAVSQYTGYWNRMTNVGWPVRSSYGNANVNLTTSSFGSPGTKQYLGIPYNTFESSAYIGGVNIKPQYSSTSFVVPRTVWVAYRNAGSEQGWLGFPTGHYAPNRQNFQGGCIAHNGSGFVASTYGSALCP